jgi:hypothetical protein
MNSFRLPRTPLMTAVVLTACGGCRGGDTRAIPLAPPIDGGFGRATAERVSNESCPAVSGKCKWRQAAHSSHSLTAVGRGALPNRDDRRRPLRA